MYRSFVALTVGVAGLRLRSPGSMLETGFGADGGVSGSGDGSGEPVKQEITATIPVDAISTEENTAITAESTEKKPDPYFADSSVAKELTDSKGMNTTDTSEVSVGVKDDDVSTCAKLSEATAKLAGCKDQVTGTTTSSPPS